MTLEELRRRLSTKEDHFLERKRGTQGRSFKRALCAFANSTPEGREALLVVGVADDGEIVGVKDHEAVQQSIRDAGRECYPPISPQIEHVELDGKDVVVAVVTRSNETPHFAGRPWVRRGASTIEAPPELYDQLILSRNTVHRVLYDLAATHELVTVEYHQQKPGRTERIHDSRYLATHEASVEKVNAHWVEILSAGTCYAEPVKWIEILHDYNQGRPKLVIRHPGP